MSLFKNKKIIESYPSSENIIFKDYFLNLIEETNKSFEEIFKITQKEEILNSYSIVIKFLIDREYARNGFLKNTEKDGLK